MIAKLVYKHLQSSEEAKKLHIMVYNVLIHLMKNFKIINFFFLFFFFILRILFQLFKNNGLLLVSSGQIY